MSVVRRTSVIAISAALLALSGCGGDDEKKPASSDPTTGTSATVSATGTPTDAAESPGSELTSSSSASNDPTASTGGDCATSKGIPDGTWEGPLTMNVRGSGGGTSGKSGYADSKGTGKLRVVVANSKVTKGTWSLAWKSEGSADTGQAAASITLDGTVKGILRGPATKPVLPGTWKIDGTVTVTKPQKYTAPVNETGEDTETMKILAADCDEVTGTFVPSFNSKDAAATFTGKAEWKGTPTD
jgi:hypothetical protein